MSNDRRQLDPRWLQISALSMLLVFGVVRLDFNVSGSHIAAFVITAIATQFACTKIWQLSSFDPRSALISSLSRCLLLRTDSAVVASSAALITIASKFLIRFRGKHLFNPTNFGIVVLLLLSDRVWVSPGQWGTGALLAFLGVCIGLIVPMTASGGKESGTRRQQRLSLSFRALERRVACRKSEMNRDVVADHDLSSRPSEASGEISQAVPDCE